MPSTLRLPLIALALATVLHTGASAWAGVSSQAAREAAEYIVEKFERETAHEGVDVIAARLEKLAAAHGDEAVEAVKKVGPKAFGIIAEAGEHQAQAVKLLAKYGDDAAVWIFERPTAVRLLSDYGDDAARALIKQKGIAEPILEQFGKPAATALETVDAQNGRRLAMMVKDGELNKIGRTPEVLDVVSRYGDKGMDFVWKNKGALAIGTVLAAFLANPQPFIDGTQQLAATVADKSFGEISREAGKGMKQANWTVVLVAAIAAAGAVIATRYWIRQRMVTKLKSSERKS